MKLFTNCTEAEQHVAEHQRFSVCRLYTEEPNAPCGIPTPSVKFTTLFRVDGIFTSATAPMMRPRAICLWWLRRNPTIWM